MLEYALKQERAKFSKLKYGSDGGDIGPPPQDEDGVDLPPLEHSDNIIAVTNSNWKQVYAYVHLLIHSFIRSFVHSFIRSVVHSFIRSFVRSFIRSFVHPFFRSFVHSFIRSSVRSFVR